MAWKPQTPLKQLIFSLLVVSQFLLLCPVNLSAQIFKISSNPRETRIIIQNVSPEEVKLLNFSPASKILLKLTPRNGDTFHLPADLAIPRNSSLFTLKDTPIDQQNHLIVIQLFEKLPFSYRWKDGIGVVIAIEDSIYRNILENEYRRGLFYQQRGNLKTALKFYRKVVFKNRKHPYAYYKAGQIRFQWKQYRLAEINFKHAVNNQCDSVGIYGWLAKLYEVYGNTRLAQEYRLKYRDLKQLQLESENQTSPGRPQNAPIKIKLVNKNASNTGYSTPSPPNGGANSAQMAKVSPPFKVLIYLAGIVIFSLLGFSWLFFKLVKKISRKSSSSSQGEEETFQVNFTERKQKVLELVEELIQSDSSQNKPDPTETKKLEKPLEMLSESFPSTESLGRDRFPQNSRFHYNEDSQTNAPLRDDELDKKTMARELNLGVGEIELALNLSSRRPIVNRRKDVHEKIRRLHQQNLSVQEIARQVNLGQNEVELILKFSELEEAVE